MKKSKREKEEAFRRAEKIEIVREALKDFEKRTKKRPSLNPGLSVGGIGGLYFCNWCFNVHRPGPCMDLGISPTKFSKRMKKKYGLK